MDMSQLLRALGLQQAYQAYQQNIGEPFAAVVGGAGRGYLGLDKPEYGGLLSDEAYKTGQAMGYLPALGAPAGAFKAAAQAPGLLSDAAQFLRNLSPEQMGLLGITAFHGSPHRFSKFDSSKIGTGEGAQAYGRGLYFAESPDVAKSYQQKLTPGKDYVNGELFDINKPMHFLAHILNQNSGDLDRTKNTLGILSRSRDYPGINQKAKEALSILEKGKSPKIESIKEGGAFYTVDIPDEIVKKMISWDDSLEKQPVVMDLLRNFAEKKANQINGDIYGSSPLGLIESEMQKLLPKAEMNFGVTGKQFYEGISQAIGPEKATEFFRSIGIPGVRYLDQGSRSGSKATRNIVVFPGEEEAIKMLSVD
jgi:hypothetical protein